MKNNSKLFYFQLYLIFVIIFVIMAEIYFPPKNYVFRAEAEKQALQLDAVYQNPNFGFTVRYPSACKVDEYPFQVRPWVRANEGITGEGPWGTIYPKLGNGLVTEKAALDQYLRVYFVEMIRPEKYEFYRFQVEVCDGLPAWATLDDFGLANKSLPQATRLDIKEKDIKRGKHPTLGEYEEAETVYSAGADLTFYARQRVYLAGKRRFVVTAITNYSMLDRVEEFFGFFFENGFEIDLAAAQPKTTWPEEKILALGAQFCREAESFNEGFRAGDVPTNKQYRAYLRYVGALQVYQELPRRTPEFNDALQRMNALRQALQKRLQQLRDETRDQMNRSRFDRAQEIIDQIHELLEARDDPFRPTQREEWLVWA
jgi:hypothetical protein